MEVAATFFKSGLPSFMPQDSLNLKTLCGKKNKSMIRSCFTAETPRSQRFFRFPNFAFHFGTPIHIHVHVHKRLLFPNKKGGSCEPPFFQNLNLRLI